MDRRHFLTALAAGAAVVASGYAGYEPVRDFAADHRRTSVPISPVGHAEPWEPLPQRVPLPHGTLTALPGPGRNLALTVDDGVSSEVVGAYIRFARDTGARFTFFVTGSYRSWREHRAELIPLVESGQIQLGNHTWTHPDLTGLSSSRVAEELRRNKEFLHNSFGVDGTPYYRPPYGFHDAAVDAVAADLGYTTPTLWYGSLSDSGMITPQYLLKCAREWFRPQSIVIGHANHRPVTRVYPELIDIIRERHLTMVTLNDYFEARPAPH